MNENFSVPMKVFERAAQLWPGSVPDSLLSRLPDMEVDYRGAQEIEEKVARNVRRALTARDSGYRLAGDELEIALYLMSCIAGEPYGAHAVWLDADDVAKVRSRTPSHVRRLIQRGDLFRVVERTTAQRTGTKRWVHVSTASAPV